MPLQERVARGASRGHEREELLRETSCSRRRRRRRSRGSSCAEAGSSRKFTSVRKSISSVVKTTRPCRVRPKFFGRRSPGRYLARVRMASRSQDRGARRSRRGVLEDDVERRDRRSVRRVLEHDVPAAHLDGLRGALEEHREQLGREPVDREGQVLELLRPRGGARSAGTRGGTCRERPGGSRSWEEQKESRMTLKTTS